MTSFIRTVARAAENLRAVLPETPLHRSEFLSRHYGADIWLKREDLSPVRSYKIRGAFHFLSHAVTILPRRTVFVCASAGNHAQGFAHVCHHLGRRGLIFMPQTTPGQKIEKTRAFGGRNCEIRLVGDTFDASNAAAQAHARAVGGAFVPPFDHPDIITGQATVAHEIARQLPGRRPDLVILPVGGGGLAAGVTRLLTDLGWKTRFRFAEPAGAPSLHASLSAGRRVRLERMDTFVDGAAVAEVGRVTFRHLRRFNARTVTLIPENRLCTTLLQFLNHEGIVLEPAGALAIDALKGLTPAACQGRRIILIVSGGNFDFERLPEVKERSLRYEGLKKYFIFRFPQRPGALRTFLDHLGPEDDIARFEYLKKSARNFGSVLIGIETRRPSNFARLTRRFDRLGWAYQDITENDTLASLVV